MFKGGAAAAALLCLAALPAAAQKPEYPLHEAIRDRDWRHFVGLLQSGHNPNEVDQYGRTALLYAASWARDSYYLYAAELLRFGADADAREDTGAAPLHYAAMNGSAGIASLLADAGADVNAKTEGGGSALAFAYLHGHMDIADLLERRGAAMPETLRRRMQVFGHIAAAERRIERSAKGEGGEYKVRALSRELRRIRKKYGYYAELNDDAIRSIAENTFASGGNDAAGNVREQAAAAP